MLAIFLFRSVINYNLAVEHLTEWHAGRMFPDSCHIRILIQVTPKKGRSQ